MMDLQFLIGHPAVQAAALPFVVALVVALLLRRTGLAWLAVVAGWASMIVAGSGFAFTPLTASRRVQLLVLLAAGAGLLLDRLRSAGSRVAGALVVASAALAVWSMSTVLAQRDTTAAVLAGAAIAVFTAALVVPLLRMRDDGLAAGAAGVGLGVAVGISALLSASLGFFSAGTAVAAASGAVVAVQFLAGANLAPGLLGTLTLGVAGALFAVGSLMLAQLSWPALVAVLVVPVAASLPVARGRSFRVRLVLRTLLALAAAALPIALAWFASRGGAPA